MGITNVTILPRITNFSFLLYSAMRIKSVRVLQVYHPHSCIPEYYRSLPQTVVSEIFLSKKGIFIKWNIPQICPNCQNLRRRFCTLKVSLLFRRSYASNNVHILYFTPIASSHSLCNSSFPVSSALWSISYVYHRLVPIILSWREMAYGTARMIPYRSKSAVAISGSQLIEYHMKSTQYS